MGENIRAYNVGSSDYAQHKIQPWDIWLEYKLNPWEADIVKRILRKKKGQSRREDLEKIIHVAKELIRQIDARGEEDVDARGEDEGSDAPRSEKSTQPLQDKK